MTRQSVRFGLLGGLLLTGAIAAGCTAEPVVELARLPEGGRMPRAARDADGTIHMIFASGPMSSGDLWYVTTSEDRVEWSEPVRVNTRPHTVMAVGPVDGGQLARDADGRVHVTWAQGEPGRVLYARSHADVGAGFEPERVVWESEAGLEAGPAVAVGPGGVQIFWHAGAGDDAERVVLAVRSTDGGASFGSARAVNQPNAGACACCALAALSDAAGRVFVSYRGAGDNVRRGQRLLVSDDGGRSFTDEVIQDWHLAACPVSTATVSDGSTGVLVAWETEGQVFMASADRVDRPSSPDGAARYRRKNPSVATNGRGQTLVVWGDGPGLRSGGSLDWQVFDAALRTTVHRGVEAGTVPSGSLPAAIARSDDSFVIIY